MLQKIVPLLLISGAFSFRLAIAGAHGGLGRELIQQSLERRWSTVALVRRYDPLFVPSRSGWLSEDETIRVPFKDKKLHAMGYDAIDNSTRYDAIVFALSGRPFEEDKTDQLVASLISKLPKQCKKVCLVSAYGVGDSIRRADVGIQAMNKFYLRDTYRAKRVQEELVSNLPNVDSVIFRPRVLSYAPMPFNPLSTTRQDLARTILDWTQS